LVDRSRKLPAFFYESALGNRPVREWILGLSMEDRKLVGRDIQKVEFGWPLGIPIVAVSAAACGRYGAT